MGVLISLRIVMIFLGQTDTHREQPLHLSVLTVIFAIDIDFLSYDFAETLSVPHVFDVNFHRENVGGAFGAHCSVFKNGNGVAEDGKLCLF